MAESDAVSLEALAGMINGAVGIATRSCTIQ